MKHATLDDHPEHDSGSSSQSLVCKLGERDVQILELRMEFGSHHRFRELADIIRCADHSVRFRLLAQLLFLMNKP